MNRRKANRRRTAEQTSKTTSKTEPGTSRNARSVTSRSNFNRSSRSVRQADLQPKPGAAQFHIWLFAATIAAGIAAWFLSIFLYDEGIHSIPRPWLIGFIFLILYCFMAGTVLAVGQIKRSRGEQILFLQGNIQIVAALIAGGVLLFLGASLMQWIYGWNGSEVPKEPTSYIFVMDDSGSMEDNDPNVLRFQAVQEILEDMPKDFPYMIYRFSDQVILEREMAPVSKKTEDIQAQSSGQTAMRAALERVIADRNNGTWADTENPKVILLTDGYANDISFFHSLNSVIKDYQQSMISVSTVGLGQVDVSLMKKIANSTGGVFIDVKDARQLKNAMQDAALQYSDRDLVSVRYVAHGNILYGFLRILFLTLLGSMMGFLMAIAYAREDNLVLIGVSSLLKALVGALIMELGSSLLGISDQPLWFLLWVLIAATIATVPAARKHHGHKRFRNISQV